MSHRRRGALRSFERRNHSSDDKLTSRIVNKQAAKAAAIAALLSSLGGCITYQPPPPGVPQANLWFRLSSTVRAARLGAGICDKDERCVVASTIKLRATPVVPIRASEIVTIWAGLHTATAECPTFFLSFEPKEGHNYQLRTGYGFNSNSTFHLFDYGHCTAQLLETDAATGSAVPIPVVRRHCTLSGCEPLTASERDFLMHGGEDRPQIGSRPLFQIPAKAP